MVSPDVDGWDWPFILYVGRKWLGYTDEQVMRLTPRFFTQQLAAYKKAMELTHGQSSGADSQSDVGVGFIDQLTGW